MLTMAISPAPARRPEPIDLIAFATPAVALSAAAFWMPLVAPAVTLSGAAMAVLALRRGLRALTVSSLLAAAAVLAVGMSVVAVVSTVGTILTVGVVALRIRRHVRRLHEQAERDPMTGALRPAMLPASLRALRRRSRRGAPVSLAYVDLDGLKRVNDVYGHAAGDRLIKSFARALQATAPDGDVIVRMGGDEFVWAGARGAHEMHHLAKRLERRLLGKARFSIGIVELAPDASEREVERALADADARMYAAKHARRAGADPDTITLAPTELMPNPLEA